ncbi:MAG: glycosyltransferase [Candidatus Lambdaproteobacteria bacterium]|nr:glycosyltransferase [Candidatus Lambdaproteobacteria bacterium]
MSDSSSKVKVAIFLPSLRGGGAERIMVTLANAFAGKGLRVDLVVAKAEGPYLKDVVPSVRVVDLGSSRVLTSLPRLARYLRRERPQVMLSAMSHANVVAIVARCLSRAPTRVVVSERAHLSDILAHDPSLRGRAMASLMRWTYPLAEGAVAVSQGVADDLAATIGLPRERIRVVYNPIDAVRMAALAAEPLRHPWFEPGEPPVMLGIGRLTAQKDFTTLIRAFARLRTKRAARLMILGEGELRQELEALVAAMHVSGDVLLPGFVDNPYAYLRRARLFVLSSGWEGLPGALFEAMACGTPVVSTDCPSGPAEILENGRWGRLVPVGDVGALAQAMAEALDECSPPDVVARAREFSVERAVEGYLHALGLQ